MQTKPSILHKLKQHYTSLIQGLYALQNCWHITTANRFYSFTVQYIFHVICAQQANGFGNQRSVCFQKKKQHRKQLRLIPTQGWKGTEYTICIYSVLIKCEINGGTDPILQKFDTFWVSSNLCKNNQVYKKVKQSNFLNTQYCTSTDAFFMSSRS